MAALAVLSLAVSVRAAEPLPALFVQVKPGEFISRGGRLPLHLAEGGLDIGPYRLDYLGAQVTVPVPGPQISTVNLYNGSESQPNLPATNWIEYPEIYPGITLRLSFDRNLLKSEYLVAPGADPGKIRLVYRGATQVRLAGGDLVVDDVLVEQAPIVFQGADRIPGSFVLHQDGTVGFALGAYDSSRSMVIDPYVLRNGLYLGGAGVDKASSIQVDANGFVYVAGWTESSDFPGGVRPRSGGVEAFVLKLNPSTNQIVWATYLGGSNDDRANAIALDNSGGVFAVGFTTSPDFPVSGAHQSSYGGVRDAFAVRLSSSGTIAFSTFFGGSGSDTGSGAAVTPSGELWITGDTASSNLPVSGAYQAVRGGGSDAFVAKFTSAGALIASTFFGGSGNDRATGVAVDSAGEAYITGSTESYNLPLVSAFQPVYAGGQDAFVAKFNSNAAVLRYATYLGGAARETALPEVGTAITVDGSGIATITGITSALNFPVVNAFQTTFGGGVTDAFIARLSALGDSLVYSTYFGGSSTDEAAALARGSDGTIIVAGTSVSTDLSPFNAVQSTNVGGLDLFAAKFSSDLRSILMTTYLGGPESDMASGVAMSSAGIWLTGYSGSAGLSFSGSFHGGLDGFVARLEEQSDVPVTITTSPPGLSVSVSGANCSQTGWRPDAPCTLSVASPQGSTSTTRYVFERWSDGSTTMQRVLSASAPFSITAQFRVEHKLSRSLSPASGGTVSVGPAVDDDFYVAGTSIQLAAAAAYGYQFVGWAGDVTAGTALVSLAMNSPVSVVANFTCSFALTNSSVGADSNPSNFSVSISTATGCPWSAASNASWISITSGLSGSGSGTVSLRTALNSATTQRSGTITIAGRTFTVIQAAGVACSYAISPSGANPPSTGQKGTLQLTVNVQACDWTAASNSSWIQVYPLAGRGNATIEYTVFPNFSTRVRAASLDVSGRSFSVSQAPGSGTYNERFAGLMYFNFFGRIGGPGEIAVQADALNKGTPPGELANNFFNTAEFNSGGRFTAGLYVGLLNRDAEFSGWLFQRNALSTGIVSPSQLVGNFMSSAEYGLLFGNPSNQEFVRLLYRYILLREASPNEVNFHAGTLAAGLSRIQLAVNFLNSNEFRTGTGPRLTSFLIYACTMLRDGTQIERRAVEDELMGGQSVKTIFSRLIANAEFSELLR